MYIDLLNIYSFRNYEEENIEFSKGLNIILGDNAQGKTNLIESIYFSCFGKSFRTNKVTELINMESEIARCSLHIVKKDRKETIEYNLHGKFKKFKVNKVNVIKMQELLGTVNVIIFTPEDLKIVKDNPQERRKFLNREISQIHPKYFRKYASYTKILNQRNELLKTLSDQSKLTDTLTIWNQQLAEYAADIIEMRKVFIDELNNYIDIIHKEITQNEETLSIEYNNAYYKIEDLNERKKAIEKDLEKRTTLDIKRGYTSVGPHRDDISFKIDELDIKTYGSQGQKRTTVLCLKLAEVEIINHYVDEYPILLLDDVLSELDLNRQAYLLKYTNKLQTIITTATMSKSLQKKLNTSKIINIMDGKCR